MTSITPHSFCRLAGCAVLLLACGTVFAQTGEVAGVHDPAVIRDGEYYYLCSTGTGLPLRRSKDLMHWERCGQVFQEMPASVRASVPEAKDLWAPDLSHIAGRFHLYYSASVFGKNKSCIALATSATLDPTSPQYGWRDEGVVLETRPGRDDFNAIDAHLAFDQQGQPWLAFGSAWSGIKLCRIDPRTGKRPAGDSSLHSLASRNGKIVEAPFIVHRGGYYYLFVSFDQCCRGVESTYRTLVGRSREITGPYVDRLGRSLMEGGGTPVISSHDHVRGPGHNAVVTHAGRDYLVHHFYDARAQGRRTLQIRPLLWAPDGWPLPGEPGVVLPPADARAELRPADVAGKWLHSAGFRDSREIELLGGGHIDREDARARWRLDGTRLTLSWPKKGSRESWTDACILSPDGQWYVGRNQNDELIRGRRAGKM